MRGRVAIAVAAVMLVACGNGGGATTTDVSAGPETPAQTSSARAEAADLAASLLTEWVDAWAAHDADRIAAVFTEDGTYVNPFGEVVTGHAAMTAYVDRHGEVRNGVLGEFTEIEAGIFRVRFTFEARDSSGWKEGSGDLEVELDGDLASRIEFLDFSGFR